MTVRVPSVPTRTVSALDGSSERGADKIK